MTEQQATPPGWYPDPNDATSQRYWDGNAWTENRAPAAQQAAPQVVAAGPHVSVAKVPKKTSHTFHLLMTVFTCGVWGLFVWLPITVWNRFRKDKVVTRYQ